MVQGVAGVTSAVAHVEDRHWASNPPLPLCGAYRPFYASSSASMEWHVMRVCIIFRFWATVLIPTLQGQSPHGSMPGAPGPGLARNRHQLTRESDPKAAVASIVTRAGRAEQRQGRARRRGALGGAGGASRQRQGA